MEKFSELEIGALLECFTDSKIQAERVLAKVVKFLKAECDSLASDLDVVKGSNQTFIKQIRKLQADRAALLKLLGELQDEVKQAADLIWDLRIPYEHKGRPVEEASSILNNLLTRIEQIQKEGV